MSLISVDMRMAVNNGGYGTISCRVHMLHVLPGGTVGPKTTPRYAYLCVSLFRKSHNLQICMPSVWISRSYMEKVLAQIADSKKLFVDSRKVIEEMYGPPPNSKDFQSDTLVL